MIEPDLDDTHLCIKCSSTIVGLENYIQHRKRHCGGISSGDAGDAHKISNSSASGTSSGRSGIVANTLIANTRSSNLDHTYDSFAFTEPEPPSSYVHKSEHGGKTSKALGDCYDLPYELGADVFFSSLQLQSVQSSAPNASGGKTSSSTQPSPLQRQKSLPVIGQQESAEQSEAAWIDSHAGSSHEQHHDTDTLMKAISDMSDVKKPYEVHFKPIAFVQESPEASEEEEEEVDAELDDDDEDYDPMPAAHASGGKWKLPLLRQSPPVVPATHTGGKWKPENRPNLRVTHSQLTRLSPNWDEQLDEVETAEVADTSGGEHPPADHTKGKWIPGTKLQRLEYKEELVQLARSNDQQHYWCNICCRRLKSKSIYENHLKTSYHLKRAEPEQQLEKASLDQLQQSEICKSFVATLPQPPKLEAATQKKRRRRASFIKCELCKHVIHRQLIGKHLISHYHYRRLRLNPGTSLHMILDNIHSIVLQSPYQCRPCRFYCNTEETFLQHWNSADHLDASEGPGKFWCSYCRFECEDNNQMRRHLLSADHKDVILAINRSVPICISKKLSIGCGKCRQSFRYNMELRRHMQLSHAGVEYGGTASDAYQSRHTCALCADNFHSKVALQRHEKHKHCILKYFCSICKLEFNTPYKARQHRKTLEHRQRAVSTEKAASTQGRRTLPRKHAKSTKVCDKCDFIATSEVEAMLHELSHPESGFCATAVAVKPAAKPKSCANTLRKLHSPEAKETPPIKCKDCDELCATLQALKVHRDCKHPLLSHVCMSCGQSFALAQALGRHARICQPPSTSAAAAVDALPEQLQGEQTHWQCEQCNFSAAYKSELLYHRLHHAYGPLSKNQRIDCPLCDKQFRKHSLRCHLRQHTDEKIFECQFCGLKFSRRHNLKQHTTKLHMPSSDKATASAQRKQSAKRDKDADGKYQCDTCGKVFALKHALKAHSIRHGSAERKFACSFEGCAYAAVSKAILKIHLASHSQQQFRCEHEACSYIGKSLLHLKRHLQSHYAPSKLYSCDQCDFKARIKGHIRRHLITHTGEKQQQCPHCDFRCSSLDNLRKHVLKTSKHPGKFIYECTLCERQVQQLEPEAKAKAIFKTNSHQEFQLHLASIHK